MFKLLRYYTITSFVVFVVAIVALNQYTRDRAIQSLVKVTEDKNIALTQSFANTLWKTHGSFLNNTQSLSTKQLKSHPQTLKLKEDVDAWAQGLPVLKVKVFDPQGRTVFSTSAKQIGQDKRKSKGFQAAIQGQSRSFLNHKDTFTGMKGRVKDRNLLSSYLSLRPNGPDGSIEGVFELYTDVTPLLERVETTQHNILWGTSGVLGLLYGVLLGIVYRGDRIIQEKNAAAAAAVRAKDDFLAMMSHEIRTPMNGVIGMTGLLLDTELTSQQQEFTETIRKSGDSLLTLINDILDYSKIEAGKLDLEKQEFNIRVCVEDALELVASRVGPKEIELAGVVEPDVPQAIWGDVTRLRQILVNLLGNAIKFTQSGEVVVNVSAELLAADTSLYELCFAVRDTGMGIPAERQNRLFKSFSQVDSSTTRKFGGTGLGLAICKRLSELMGGRIWVESEEGQGSTFAFTIQAEEAEDTTVLAQSLPAVTLKDKRVLIVDDNDTNQQILTLQTESWKMRPQVAASGYEALGLLEHAGPFDIAILDMQMPEMDGLTLAQKICSHPRGTDFPLVMLTSIGQAPDFAHHKGLFSAWLNKPIKQSQLYNALVKSLTGNEVKTQKSTTPQLDTEMAARHPLKILLAEDNPVNQKLAVLILAKLGYRPDVVGNGLEVLQAIKRQPYDVILMDVRMPEMDGLTATTEICQRWSPDERPYIIAMTANAMQGDRETCLDVGMDGYISKPVRIPELKDALSRCQPIQPKPIVETIQEPAPAGDLDIGRLPSQPSMKAVSATSSNFPAISSTETDGAGDHSQNAEHLNFPPVEFAPIPSNSQDTSPPVIPMEQSKMSNLPNEPTILDPTVLDSLRQMAGENASLLIADILSTYLEDAPGQVDALQQAVDNANPEALSDAAHALKSASANLGAIQLSELCAEAEALGREGSMEGAQETVSQICQAYQTIHTYFTAEIAKIS